ncbi:MAG: hypothetical protein J0I92_06445 [Phyllobacterium sp.]|nr:hypothetical protein [Phyllobacterium sp.]
MTAFRIHYADGSTIVVDADNPKAAAARASAAGHTGHITKIKVARDTDG